MFRILGFIFFIGIPLFIKADQFAEKPIVVVIPSYNNERWVEINLDSVLSQNYNNYRVIYINDCSTDNTRKTLESFLSTHERKNKVTLINNKENQGALKNIYNAVHSCDDEEIIVTLDGDDWLFDSEVLNTLNHAYSSRDRIWVTHGTYINSDGSAGISSEITQITMKRNAYRQKCQPSHLRTFYAWLFKKIRKNDLFYEGEFFKMTWDLAIMFPMLEMAGPRQKFIDHVLYVYNIDNPINDHRKDRDYQLKLEKHIRNAPKYSHLKSRDYNWN